MQAIRNFFKEFRQFAVRGNVIDLAIGVVIGTAFGRITTALVSDVATPLINILLGKVPTTQIQIGPIMIGNVLNAILDFIVTAFIVFLFIKMINRLYRKEEKKAEAAPSAQEKLLEEIRDLLKEGRPAKSE